MSQNNLALPSEQEEKYGLFKGMSNEVYHNERTEISNSGLKIIIDQSPAHYFYQRLDPERPKFEMTDALRFGQAFHTMLLEPDEFNKRVVVWSGLPRNTKAGKDAYAEACAQLTGDMILLKQDEYDKCKIMADRILSLSVARQFITAEGDAEASLFWKDEVYGVDCKARIDYITKDGFLIDIKTAENADHYTFRRRAYDYRYYMQAHYYMRAYKAVYGRPAKGFCFIVTEKQAPHVPAVYYATEEEIMLGEYDANRGLEKYAECLNKGSWDGYPDRFEPLGLPSWGLNRLENGDN